MLRRWHAQWRQDVRLPNPSEKVVHRSGGANGVIQEWKRRRRLHGQQGRPVHCPWLRQALFEWFTAMRYSIDWKAVRGSLHSGGGNKCLARFTRQLVKQKAQQLLTDYLRECLLRGQDARAVQLTPRWFSHWEADYGLSMRKANRKYKVPRTVMAERLEIGWLNVARVRALCLACHGYDPHIENWDQSPFHHNESGSQSLHTLAVAGATVPLLEGHADTRERWTGNFTTFSDKARLMSEGPPYCEFMFKASGDALQLRLREHIRTRGFGPWVTVSTSEKGSYQTEDVLAFLDRHLPLQPQSRPWRIIMADDFSAHLSPLVFKLCWSRGYVFLAHGGGVTPVVQTCDTDLNQHVKRAYTAIETSELLRQMRDGVRVPRCRPEQCMDMMVEVMSKTALHIQAADGYLKTGLRVALDGSEDVFVVREAAVFWHERQMRAKINSAVAEVAEEVAADRLHWNVADVKRLILPYPKKAEVDAILARQADDTWLAEGEAPYEEDGAESSGDEGWGKDEHLADDALLEIADAEEEPEGPARSCGLVAAADGNSAPTTAAEAENIAQSLSLIATYESAIASLKAVGAMKAVINLENDIQKERRRMRACCKESPDVLLALARQRDEEQAKERARLLAVADANARTLSAAKLKQELAVASATLRKRKAMIMEAETLVETKHAVKTFSLEDLGHGRSRGGGAAGRKRRHEVLDRLARLGQGLSPAQKNDFSWWRDSWDAKMLEEHGDEWPNVFAQWVQRVLSECEGGVGNAFSEFVHAETRRCFNSERALHVP